MIYLYARNGQEFAEPEGVAMNRNPLWFTMKSAAKDAELVYTDDEDVRKGYESLGVEVRPLPQKNEYRAEYKEQTGHWKLFRNGEVVEKGRGRDSLDERLEELEEE